MHHILNYYYLNFYQLWEKVVDKHILQIKKHFQRENK